jgi:hypothetical protein
MHVKGVFLRSASMTTRARIRELLMCLVTAILVNYTVSSIISQASCAIKTATASTSIPAAVIRLGWYFSAKTSNFKNFQSAIK